MAIPIAKRGCNTGSSHLPNTRRTQDGLTTARLGPLVISNTPALFGGDSPVAATAIRDLILAHVFTSPG